MTRLEKSTNVAIILTCAFLIANLTRNHYLGSTPQPRPAPEIEKGTEIHLPGSPTAGSPYPTLALALRKGCRFCQESVGFYQRLTAFKSSSPQKLRIVAVMPETRKEAAAYLKQQGIEVDELVTMETSKLGVRGTPTLLLLDERNRLEKLWVGKLTDLQEKDVFESLKTACGGCSFPGASLAPTTRWLP